MPNLNQPPHDPSSPNGGEGFNITLRSFLAFIAWFLLIFVVLLLLWRPLGSGYGRLFRAAGTGLVPAESRSRIWFESPEGPTNRHDVQVVVGNPKEHTKRSTKISSRRHGYMPTAFMLALTLATPVAWPRRLRSALWALLWVNLYVVIKLALFPMAYGGDDPVGAFSLAGILRRIFWVVGASSVGWMLVPLLIWATLTLRVLMKPRTFAPS